MKFKVFSLPIYLTLILLSTFALAETAAQTDECELLLDYSHPRLTPELVSKIDRVSESDAYTLQMLRRLKGDHEQVVILIGEQHFKKPEDKESGADLIKESSLRGFESAELLPKSLIERIFPFIIKSMITKLKRETGSVASTSIFDALDLDGIILNHLTTTVENATEEEMDNLREDFNTLSDEELKKRIAFKLYDNWESEITVTWFDMKDTIQRFLSSIPEERKTVTFNIEEGYQPGFYDRLKNFYTDVPLIILAPSALSL
ncbi:MAG: hypothetical protein HYY62_04570, partial [Deltaproteobacteria bacterium]|nr:hypothetical protein [Deltaproteobacteria bacterium]